VTRKRVPEATGWLNRDNIEKAQEAATKLAQVAAKVLTEGNGSSVDERSAAAGSIYPLLSELTHYVKEVVPACMGSVLEEKATEVEQAEEDAETAFFAMICAVEARAYTAALGQFLMSATTAKSRLQELEAIRFEKSTMRRER
jgi:hypothetical protein